jgi:uncharacterized protein (TIGR00304 family)
MNKYHFLSLFFFILGIVFLIIGVLSGNIEVGFFIFFPFLIGTGLHAFFGFIFVFLGVILYISGFFSKISLFHEDSGSGIIDSTYSDRKKSVKGGGVVLIGPIPIVFGSNWKITVVMIVLTIILVLISFFLFKI